MNGRPHILGQSEVFDRMHGGAVVIDPEKCALALFVDRQGQVSVKSGDYSHAQVAGMLRDIADHVEKGARR